MQNNYSSSIIVYKTHFSIRHNKIYIEICALNTELVYLQYAWKGKGGEMRKIGQLNFLYFVVRLLNNYNCNAVKKRENKGL